EDLLLAEGERLVLARDYAKAFEHYLAVQARAPGWKGLDEHVNKLLFEEGTNALLLENDRERGLRLLSELYARQPDYPGLADRLSSAFASRIGEAFSKGAYRQGRKLLHELATLAPSHSLERDWREKFIAKAKTLAAEAEKKTGAERLDALLAALRVWPDLPEVASRYTEAFAAVPTLDVAVVDWHQPASPYLVSPAAERVARLQYRPILAGVDDGSSQGQHSDQLATGLETTDLGHRILLKLRPGIPWSDGSRTVSSLDVVRALSERAAPRCLGYSARWASLLERIEATDTDQVEIRLKRTPLKIEAWLIDPIGPAHAGPDGLVPRPGGGRRPVGNGPFLWDHSEKDGAEVFLANEREGTSAGAPKIRRLREIRWPTSAAALGALLRGEVSLVERVPPDQVARLSQTAGIQVGRYTQPSLHRVALDGRNPALRNRTLRRALSYAIDRKTLLEETLLRRAIDDANLPSDGPFAKGSYADAPDVRPLEYDPLLAKMLVAAARKELGNAPIRLTFEYPAAPEAQAVAPKLIEMLREAGLEIKGVERPESDLERELRAGRKFDLAYRSSRVIEPAWEVGPLICPGYDAPPATEGLAAISSPRILQLLLQLEQAQEWPSARAILTQLDRECRDELPIIPLWQLEDHYAWRTRLHGPGATAEHLYQGIASWEIEPWVAKDPWTDGGDAKRP
ncbi:MAG: ABC transporter substrate-binding protein, partial [Isosphaeraceae bacterium]|nr:ABC transporter substrate-binding protein [Isosphaeraceae bacterium]